MESKRLRLGFVPLVDCAPLVMAHELGLFTRHGLDVTLSRELGWATIRDKIMYRELDAAQAVAGLVFATTLGLGSVPCDCVTGLVLNLHGNAITISRALHNRGVTNAGSLRRVIAEDRDRKTYTFGMVSQYSSHHFLLRQWLASGGIDPTRDVRLVVVPPAQTVTNLQAGHLDGFCVGEPWNTVAVQTRAGICAGISRDLAPLHPEKVLLVRAAFAQHRADEHVALVAALLEACAFCDDPANRAAVAALIAQPQYVNAPVRAVRASLCDSPDFHIFHAHNANRPTAAKAAWVYWPLAGNNAPVPRLFREDIYEQALERKEQFHHELQPA